eukprot:NODE_203_length_14950_cov_0.414450.p5 type:complete len:384 gc:universal NODE_203_length_14950_cov_0.414450:7670-6519(-)
MSVFYKFISAKSYNKIACDGLSIDISTLKQEIATKMHLKGFLTDFDLIVCNEQDETYSELDKVPRNAKVLLKRVPISNKQKVNVQQSLQPVQSTSGYIPGTTVTTNQLESLLLTIPGLNQEKEEKKELTEDEKIALMFNNEDLKRPAQQQQQIKRPKGELPPPNYVCYKCGLKNHWIYDCPNVQDEGQVVKRVSRATGIPKSMLNIIDKVPVNGIQNLEGDRGELMVTGDGSVVQVITDESALQNLQGGTVSTDQLYAKLSTEKTPPTWKCVYCLLVARNCMKLPCTHTACEVCLNEAIEQAKLDCPKCNKSLRLDQCKANSDIRKAIMNKLKRMVKTTDDVLNPVARGKQQEVPQAQSQQRSQQQHRQGSSPRPQYQQRKRY